MYYYIATHHSTTYKLIASTVIYCLGRNDISVKTIKQKVVFTSDDFLIGTLQELKDINLPQNSPVNIICIYVESFLAHKNNLKDMQIMMSKVSKDSIFKILTYQADNIKHFKKFHPDKDINYLPLTANPYFEKIGQSINHLERKTIDVLFYGWAPAGSRRRQILNQLNRVTKVSIIVFDNYHKLNTFLSKTKIVLDIFFYENNKPFDFYRLSYLIQNEIFVIVETPSCIDFNIEPNLKKYSDYIVTADRNDLGNVINHWLKKSQMERNEKAKKAKEWFESVFDFEKDFITTIHPNKLSKGELKTFFKDAIQDIFKNEEITKSIASNLNSLTY